MGKIKLFVFSRPSVDKFCAYDVKPSDTLSSISDSLGMHSYVHCNTLQHTATHCNTLQHTATHRSPFLVLRRALICALQHTATHSNTLQLTATPRSPLLILRRALTRALQHRATHCSTLQYTDTLSLSFSDTLGMHWLTLFMMNNHTLRHPDSIPPGLRLAIGRAYVVKNGLFLIFRPLSLSGFCFVLALPLSRSFVLSPIPSFSLSLSCSRMVLFSRPVWQSLCLVRARSLAFSRARSGARAHALSVPLA